MEEVDSILVYTLKQIGCDVGSSLGELSPTQIIRCVSRCLELIKPDLEIFPYDGNISMSSRYKVASEIAQYIIDLGYSEEIGCQSFLYPTETDTRKFLIFLIERLPKDVDSDLGNKLETLLSRIAQDKESANSKKENTIFLNGVEVAGIRLPAAVDINSLPKETLRFYASHLADITFAKEREKFKNLSQQPPTPQLPPQKSIPEDVDDDFGDPDAPEPELIPSVLEKAKVTEKPKPKVPEKPKPKVKPPPIKEKPKLVNLEEENNRKREEENVRKRKEADKAEADAEAAAAELKAMQDETQAKVRELQAKEKSAASLNQTLSEMELEIESLKEETERKGKELNRQKRTRDLMIDSSGDGLDKVKKAVETQTEKLLNLANQWEKHRVPLIEEIRSKRGLNANKLSETAKKKEDIRLLKSRLKEMGQEAKAKEEIYAHLLAEYEKMPKDLNRSSYTKRICEIIGNIKKQKKEITKVLGDTKEIKKDINTLSGRLDRTFTVADELIFKDAEKDKNVAQSYKLLVAIHSDFSRIINVLEEIGNSKRLFRDLEDKLELERGKNVEGKLERLRADLGQMKHENQILQAKLRDPSLLAARKLSASSSS